MTRTAMRKAVAACIATLLLFAGLSAMGGCGGEDEAYSPSTAQEFSPLVDLGSTVALSSDQARLISEHGYPSHFFITMDPLTSDRVETWTYFSLQESYTFHQGRRIRKETVQDQSGKYPPTTLKPEDFGPDLSLTGAESMLGKPYQDSGFTDSEGSSVIILFYQGAVLDYTDGKLTGIETMVSRFEDFPEVTFP